LLKNTEKAISDFTHAISLNPDYRDAYNNRGQSYSDLGEFDLAIDDYSRAIDLDSRYWFAFNNRAIALWEVGRKDEALLDYEIVSKIFESE
jgi:lipoprotein NlpI